MTRIKDSLPVVVLAAVLGWQAVTPLPGPVWNVAWFGALMAALFLFGMGCIAAYDELTGRTGADLAGVLPRPAVTVDLPVAVTIVAMAANGLFVIAVMTTFGIVMLAVTEPESDAADAGPTP